MAISKLQRQERRKSRVRFKLKSINLSNKVVKPRLSIFRSNNHIYAQIIDDIKGVTLVSASSLEKELKTFNGKLSLKATEVGRLIGKRALEKGIKDVIYDRGSYKYHGVILSLIEALRGNFAN